jgi:hypothetical protein
MKVPIAFLACLVVFTAIIGVSDVIAGDTGPVSRGGIIDEQWDLVFWYPGTTDVQYLGIEFTGGLFYIAGCVTPGFPEVWVFDTTGVLVFSFPQWTTGWGWHDLAYDGQFLYGASDYIVYAFDLEGYPEPSMNITAPIFCRALAYDPNTDTFWGGGWSSPLVNFDRDGNVIWESGPGGPSISGLAWDDFAPNGPWLWIHSQEGGCTLYQFDPSYHVYTGLTYQVPLMPGLTSQLAGGLAFSEEYSPDYSVMIGLIQGIPYDGFYGLEMYPANPPPDVSITISAGGPIVIPNTGGSFDYNVEVFNNESGQAAFDAWIMVYLPDGIHFRPVLGPVSLTLPGGQSLSRDRTQDVPAGAPSGTYTYVGYVGFYPDAIADSSFFTFEKSAGSLVESSGAGWYTSGNFFSGSILAVAVSILAVAVDEWDTLTCYPNPFNPLTTLQFSLQEGGIVDLSVFDVAGRKAVTLMDGYLEAGTHVIEFDGSRLASGVYICKLVTPEQMRQLKIVLVR